MTENEMHPIICSRCGDENGAEVYFCKKCGIGLDLLMSPGTGEIKDVDLGPLLKAGFLGGILGVFCSFFVLAGLHVIARRFPQMLNPVKDPYLFFISIQLSIPLFFAIGSSIWIYVKGKSCGLVGSFWRTLFGSLLALPIALLFWGSSKVIGVSILALLPPVLGARIGLGVLAPLWTKRKMIMSLIIALLISGLFFLLKYGASSKSTVKANAVLAISRQPGGPVWMANGKGEIFTISDGDVRETSYVVSKGHVQGICPINKDRILVWTSDRGIIEFSDRSAQLHLSQRKIYAILIHQGNLIVGTDTHCFFRPLDSKTWNKGKLLQRLVGDDASQVPIIDLRSVDQKIVAAVFQDGLYVSTSVQAPWRRSSFPDSFPLKVVPYPAHSHEVLVVTPTMIYKGDLSSDEWTTFSAGLPPSFQPETLSISDQGDVFIISQKCVYTKTLVDNTWSSIGSIPVDAIYSMVWIDDHLYLGTDNGLYTFSEGIGPQKVKRDR